METFQARARQTRKTKPREYASIPSAKRLYSSFFGFVKPLIQSLLQCSERNAAADCDGLAILPFSGAAAFTPTADRWIQNRPGNKTRR